MPEIFAPPGILPVANLRTLVRDAALSALRGAPELQADGTLGIKTIEAAWPQREAPWKRAYTADERPAIWVWATLAGRAQVAQREWNVTYRVHVGVATDGADNREQLDLHGSIVDAALQTLAFWKDSAVFVEGYQCDSAVFAEQPGDPELNTSKKNPFQLVSVSTSDFGLRARVGE